MDGRASRPFVLAALRTLRLDPDCGSCLQRGGLESTAKHAEGGHHRAASRTTSPSSCSPSRWAFLMNDKPSGASRWIRLTAPQTAVTAGLGGTAAALHRR